MALLFALIGGFMIGWVGNSTAGFVSFIVIWFLMSAYEEMETQAHALQHKMNELEAEKKQDEPSRLEKQISDFEESAEEFKRQALRDSLGLGKERFEFLLRRTGDDYINLKNRLSLKLNWRLDLARDWYDYARTVNELSSIQEMINVCGDDRLRYDSLWERWRTAQIKAQDLEQAFQRTCGHNFVSRWEEWDSSQENEKYV